MQSASWAARLQHRPADGSNDKQHFLKGGSELVELAEGGLRCGGLSFIEDLTVTIGPSSSSMAACIFFGRSQTWGVADQVTHGAAADTRQTTQTKTKNNLLEIPTEYKFLNLPFRGKPIGRWVSRRSFFLCVTGRSCTVPHPPRP